MNNNELWDKLLISVKNCYADAIKISNSDGITQTCASAMRSTIEGLVKLFYLQYYRRSYDNHFKLDKSLKNNDFRKHFTGAEYADIDRIRFVGNKQVHFVFGEQNSPEDIVKTFNRAVKALQEKLKITIIIDNSATNNMLNQPKNENSIIAQNKINCTEESSTSPRSCIVHRGQIFNVRKNYELLNILLNRNMKGYYRCWYRLADSYTIDMQVLNEIHSGWTNRIEEPDMFYMDFVGNPDEKLVLHDDIGNLYIALFIKSGKGNQKHFTFYGVYKRQSNSFNNRVYKRISDELNLENLPY